MRPSRARRPGRHGPGRGSLGLEAVEQRRGVELAKPAPPGGHVAGVPDRDRERVRRLAELLGDLEGGRLLALDPVRVDRVDELDRMAVGERPDDLERLVEVAAQGDHPRTVHQRLGELADRDPPLGHDHRAAQPGAGGVGGRARRRVPGRGADHRLCARPLRPRHREGHPAVLEARGRVRALELQQHARADALGDHRRLHERRRALVQADDRIAGLERQPVAIPLDEGLGAHQSAVRSPQTATGPLPTADCRLRTHTNSSSITRIARGAARRKSSFAIWSSAA